MNNGNPAVVLAAFALIIATIAEVAAGHWLNAAVIGAGAIAVGLLARWLVKRLT